MNGIMIVRSVMRGVIRVLEVQNSVAIPATVLSTNSTEEAPPVQNPAEMESS